MMRAWIAAAAAALAFCAGAAEAGLFGPSGPTAEYVYYAPRVMASTQDAMNTLASLRKYYSYTIDCTATTVDLQISPEEVRLVSVINWSETGYTWVPSSGSALVGGHFVFSSGGSSQPYSVDRSEDYKPVILTNKIEGIYLARILDGHRDNCAWTFMILQEGKQHFFGARDRETAEKVANGFYTLWAATWPEDRSIDQGLGVDDVEAAKTPARLKRLGWKNEDGYVVVKTTPGSPAEAAGLKEDDILYAITGPDGVAHPLRKDVKGMQTWETLRLIAGDNPAVTVTLNVFRDEKEITLSASVPNPNFSLNQFRANRAKAAAATQVAATAPPAAPPKLGVFARDLTNEEKAQAAGVMVMEVDAGSIAAQMGMKPGDILVELNGTALTGLASMRDVLAAGPVSSAKVLRQGNAQTLLAGSRM